MLGNTLFMVLALQTGIIAVVDFRTYRIPDISNLLLALTGAATWALRPEPFWMLITAPLLAGLLLLLVRGVHASWSGRTGLGLGDVKMGVAAGFWLGPLDISLFLTIASAAGIVFALARSAASGDGTLSGRIPFGPFLGASLLGLWTLNAIQVGFLKPFGWE